MERVRSATLLVVVALGASCLNESSNETTSRLGVALTMPMADVGEVRSFGLFAVTLIEPEFDCDSYRAGEYDPIAQSPESLVAVDYVDITRGEDNYPVSFRGVPTGELSILVEAYDGGGSRIFLGCEQALVEAGRTTPIDMTMAEDPGEREGT